MMRQMAVLTVSLSLCAAVIGADDQTKPGKATIEPVQLSVSRKPDRKDLPTFFLSSQTSLQFLLTLKGKNILAIDSSMDPTTKKSASAVTEFKDDKDTDFIKASKFGPPTFTGNNFSKDRSTVGVGLSSFGNAPAKGATKLLIKGKVVLICGEAEKTTEEKEVEMKEKAETKIGDFTVTVIREKGFGGSGANFQITAPNPNIKGLTLKDADGKKVDLQMSFFASTYYNPFNKVWTFNYSLAKPVPKVKLAITYFSKTEKVDVPIDLSLSVGL